MVITENTPPNLNESVIAYHKDGISYSPSLLNFVLIKRKQHIIVSGINFAPQYIYIYIVELMRMKFSQHINIKTKKTNAVIIVEKKERQELLI